MEKQARITSKGQITVPREVRRVLGVRPGDRLLFESDAKGVRVRPVRTKSPFAKFKGIGNPGDWFRQGGNYSVGSGVAWAMTTGIDTNVIVALWDRDPSLSSAAQSALDVALGRGTLVTAATVFA